MTSTLTPSKDPLLWHRKACHVTPQLVLCGDLHEDNALALEQLNTWVAEGITDILDVREEASDESFVAIHAPDVNYIWLGTHDDGGRQDDGWFAHGVAAVRKVFADPDRRVVVHCHMGINRAPSMAFAILLAQGWDPVEALDAIRTARPIAAVLYATDAISWWLRRQGASPDEIRAGVALVEQWHLDNPHDTYAAISRIRLGERFLGGI